MHKSPIFIVGSGRSGTTILDKSMGQHSLYTSFPFEPQLWSSSDFKVGLYWLLLNGGVKESKKGVLRGYFGRRYKDENIRAGSYGFYKWFSRQDFLKEVDFIFEGNGELEERIKIFLNNLYRPILDERNAAGWVDGTPVNGRIIPQILQIYPDAKFIHIIRDGVDVANSFVRLGWGGGAFETAAQFWASQVSITRSLGKNLAENNYKEVFFDELIDDPEKNIKKLCDFVGIDFESDMLRYFDNSRASKYVNKTERYQRLYVDALLKI